MKGKIYVRTAQMGCMQTYEEITAFIILKQPRHELQHKTMKINL